MACVYYSKIPIYPIFFLLKGDYIYIYIGFLLQGLLREILLSKFR